MYFYFTVLSVAFGMWKASLSSVFGVCRCGTGMSKVVSRDDKGFSKALKLIQFSEQIVLKIFWLLCGLKKLLLTPNHKIKYLLKSFLDF
jgi:hypothetical protein